MVERKNKEFLSAIVIAIGVFLSRITGLVRSIVLASFLGSSIIAEAYYTAIRLPNTFRKIFAEGAFSNAFVPFFSAKVKENRVSANIFSWRILCILISILLIITFIFEILMPEVISVINPGFIKDPEKFNLTVNLARITFPYIILISVTSLFGSILNSIGSFWQYANISIVLNVVLVAGLYFTNNLFTNSGFCLSCAMILAGFVQLGLIFISCFRRSVLPKISINNIDEKEKIEIKKDVKSFLKKLVPAIVSSGINQINIFVDNIFVSFFAGAISYLYYTDRLIYFPLSIIGYSLSVAILPSLSIAFKEKKYENIISLQKQSINIANFFSIPLMLILFSLSTEFVKLMYQRGAFTANDTQMVASMLKIYVFSIPFSILMKVIFACFFAQKDTKNPMRVSCFSLALNVIFNLILFKFVGMYCVIISTTLSSILSCILAIILLKNKDSFFVKLKDGMMSFKIILVSIISCVCVPMLLKNYNLFLILIACAICHLVLCFVTKIISKDFIKSILKK